MVDDLATSTPTGPDAGRGVPGDGRSAAALERAEQSVATRFSRVMKASTSPWGMLTDPPIVAISTAPAVLAALAAAQLGAAAEIVRILVALAFAPTLLAVAIALALGGARSRLVAWLSSLPFSLDNMNAVLNGLGAELEVTFTGEPPTSESVNPALDEVHTDCFVTDVSTGARTMVVRVGVVDSKRNPARTNHERFVRVRAIVDRVLVPLHARAPIASVRVK